MTPLLWAAAAVTASLAGPGVDAMYWPLLDKASAALGRRSSKGNPR